MADKTLPSSGTLLEEGPHDGGRIIQNTESRDELVKRVDELTAELNTIKSRLQNEIYERAIMAEELLESHDELEMRVQERTKALEESEDRYRSLVKNWCCPYLVDISHILLLNLLLVEFTFLQEVSNERDWEMFLPERTLQGFRHTQSRQHCRAWQVRQGQES